MRLLICGSREWPGTWEYIAAHIPSDVEVIIHGACSRIKDGRQVSVDMLADRAARDLGRYVEAYPVDHALDGPWPGAGPRRNERMFRLSRPNSGLAFGALWRLKDGRTRRGLASSWKPTGTGGMVGILLAAGLPVRWVAAPWREAVDLLEMPSADAGGVE